MELAKLVDVVVDAVPVRVEFGKGKKKEVVTLHVARDLMSLDLWRKLTGVQGTAKARKARGHAEEDDLDTPFVVIEAFCEVVKEWDLTEDGDLVPLTLDRVRTLPAVIIQPMIQAVFEAADPTTVQEDTSEPSSPPQGERPV